MKRIVTLSVCGLLLAAPLLVAGCSPPVNSDQSSAPAPPPGANSPGTGIVKPGGALAPGGAAPQPGGNAPAPAGK